MTARSCTAGPAAAHVLRLQRTAGNRATAGLVSGRAAPAPVLPVQRQEGGLQRQTGPEQTAGVYEALGRRDWPEAVMLLADLGAGDRVALISALSPEARSQLRDAAPALDPAVARPVLVAIDDAERDRGRDGARGTAPTTGLGADIAGLGNGEKLARAWDTPAGMWATRSSARSPTCSPPVRWRRWRRSPPSSSPPS